MSEKSSVNKKLDKTKAKVITAGIDVGAGSTKAAILLDGKPYACSEVTARTPKQSAKKALDAALAKAGLTSKDIQYTVATGRGSSQVPFATKVLSEVACGAAGAARVWGPSVRTVLDAGAQSCKVIHCTDKGKATDFLWNDKCAAGIGRSLESFGGLVAKDLDEMADITLQSEQYPKLSDFCAVYAQSEALDLIRSKVPVDEVITGYHRAMAKRISTLLGRAGIKGDVVIIGGLAKNRAITDLLEKTLKMSRLAAPQSNWADEWPDWDPALTVALGAALFADAFQRGNSCGS
jgi:predicted CoA-substrate-specific enzyme activase